MTKKEPTPILDSALAGAQRPLEQQVPGVAVTPPSLPTPSTPNPGPSA